MSNVPTLQTAADLMASQMAAAASQLVPAGAILPYAGSAAPMGWLVCDGAVLNKATYPQYLSLFAVIGYTFGGSGDTFNLPDLRGRFIRYNDSMGNHGISGVTSGGAATRDSGRAHGSVQAQATKAPTTSFTGTAAATNLAGLTNHTHSVSFSRTPAGNTNPGTIVSVQDPAQSVSNVSATTSSANIDHSHSVTISGGGDTETRPINISLNAIIKI